MPTLIAEPQVPAPGQVFLDHVGWFVDDMAAASQTFERLGFALTPCVEHRNAMPDGGSIASGTANRCAMMERGYLEILTAVPASETALAGQLRAGLARYAGVHVVALTTADADTERARLRAAGFDPLPVVNLRRPVALDDGSHGITAFAVVRIPPDEMPEGRIQFLAQQTPDLVWRPSLIAQDNAIEALTGVLFVVADVKEAAARCARFTGRDARRVDEGAVIVLDRGRLAFSAVDPFAGCGGYASLAPTSPPWIAAVELRSRDLAATRAWLLGRGIRLTVDAGDHLVVHPGDAAGTALVIHAAGAEMRLHSREQAPSGYTAAPDLPRMPAPDATET